MTNDCAFLLNVCFWMISVAKKQYQGNIYASIRNNIVVFQYISIPLGMHRLVKEIDK